MELSSTSSAYTTATRSTADAATTSINSDFETFLKMMTTQLQNQDPMNPIDSADYAVQLATFSGVEQQTKTNKLLEAMQTQFGVLGMAQMAGWVGAEARAVMPAQVVDGQSITLSPNPLADANRAVLVVSDSAGTIVDRVDIDITATEMEWQPVDVSGAPLPDGQYSFTLENYADDQQLDTTDVELYARITEVRGGTAGMVLRMQGGAEVPVSAVTALRG